MLCSRYPWISIQAISSEAALGPADAAPLALALTGAGLIGFLAVLAATVGQRILAFLAVTIGVWVAAATLAVYELDSAAEELLAMVGAPDEAGLGVGRSAGLAWAAAGSCLYIAAGTLALLRPASGLQRQAGLGLAHVVPGVVAPVAPRLEPAPREDLL